MAPAPPIVKFPTLHVQSFQSGVKLACLRSPCIAYRTGSLARLRNFSPLGTLLAKTKWTRITSRDAASAGKFQKCVDTKSILFSGNGLKAKSA